MVERDGGDNSGRENSGGDNGGKEMVVIMVELMMGS